VKADNEIPPALCRELEEARYEASLAARRYELVDPTKRLVARELETRWNRRWSGSPISRLASPGMMLPWHLVPRSTAQH
jgi:hypothetical protein